jgi:hypothetical protein
MIRISTGLLTCTIALLMLVPTAQSQLDSREKPLGDVAREQREMRRHQKKDAAEKVYTEVGVVPDDDRTRSGPAKSSSNSDKDVDAEVSKPFVIGSKPAKAERESNSPNHRSVLDQTPDAKPDVIIVPAGTEIRVDIVDGKVIVPVRVGFATPIPALSKVTVQVNPVYGYTGNATYGVGSVAYAENAALTAVTVRGVTYAVQANTVQLDSAGTASGAVRTGSSHDAVFILSAPLAIER